MKNIISHLDIPNIKVRISDPYVAIHPNENEAALLYFDDFGPQTLPEVPESMSNHSRYALGLISEEQYQANRPNERKRQAEVSLRTLEAQEEIARGRVEEARLRLEALQHIEDKMKEVPA